MSINLRCDNRSITKDGKYSYLVDNYPSGVSSLTITNSEGFFHNSYVLVGNIGSENTEILQLSKVDPVTNVMTFNNFSDTATGAGVNTVALYSGGTGYQVGEILTLVQAGGYSGSVRVQSVDGITGAITNVVPVTVDQTGRGYQTTVTPTETQKSGSGTFANFVGIGYSTGGGTDMAGQSVTTDSNIVISYIKFKLLKQGLPTDNLVCDICEMADKNTPIYTSAVIDGSTLTGSFTEQTFTFPGVVLSATTQYFFRVRRSGGFDTTNYYQVQVSLASTYASGNLWTNTGASWGDGAPADLYFAMGSSNDNGVETTGGGNNAARFNILSLTATTTPTTILFEDSKSFIAGQPVTAYNGSTGVLRPGNGVVAASSDPSSTTMTLVSPGIAGIVSGDMIVVGDVTKFSHSESTKVTVIQYNQVRFFRTDNPVVPNLVTYTSLTQNQDKSVTQTTTSTIKTPHTTTYTQPNDPSSITTVDFTPPIIFSGAVALTIPSAIQVNDFYTTYIDNVNSTGYGWFSFYNSSSALYSPISNSIPYSGFPQNTVKKTFEAFDSSMNTKELKLITQSDRFNWLNEALSYMTNELNLGNWEYFASEELTLQLEPGIDKYLLPQDFSDLLFVNYYSYGDLNTSTDERLHYNCYKMEAYSATFERAGVSSVIRYAVRGKYIIFYPIPYREMTVTLAYLKNSPVISSLDDVLDLPNNAYYSLKDYMRFRAYQKLGNATESGTSFSFFTKQVENMKIHAIKRDDGLDSWSIAQSANT